MKYVYCKINKGILFKWKKRFHLSFKWTTQNEFRVLILPKEDRFFETSPSPSLAMSRHRDNKAKFLEYINPSDSRNWHPHRCLHYWADLMGYWDLRGRPTQPQRSSWRTGQSTDEPDRNRQSLLQERNTKNEALWKTTKIGFYFKLQLGCKIASTKKKVGEFLFQKEEQI